MSSHAPSPCPAAPSSSSTARRTTPIDLYVDGLHFATGRLVVTDEGELAVRLSPSASDGDHRLGGGSLMARVLVVDDAAFMRKMVTDALTKGGHEVVGEASNGIEAVERYRELRPEVDDARHHHAGEGRARRPAGDHRPRSRVPA